jgi:hypothetical protein
VRKLFATIISSLLLLLIAAPLALAATTGPSTTSLSQGYLAANPLDDGALVSAAANPGIVQLATVANGDSLLGVAIKDQSALFSVTSGAGEVQVTTSGSAMALVSTVNGEVKVGDHIAPSPLTGIGAKAVANGRVIGVAQGSLDAKTNGAVKTTLKNKSGETMDVYVARVPVLVNITYFSNGDATRTLVPSFLQDLANAVAAKKVSQLPIIISVVILLVSILSSGVIIYTATRSAIVSIGRNPLARNSVVRTLIGVMILVVAILATGLGAIFLVLRLI